MWFCLFLIACFIGMCALPQPVAGQWVASSDDDDDWIHDKGGIGFADTLAPSWQEVPNLYENSTNVDGMPMCGGVDINGNVYGFTESDFHA